MEAGKQEFGVSDLEYNLVITLGNLLQGLEVMKKYAKDADEAGQSDVANLFRSIHDQNRDAAKRVRDALARQMNSSNA